MSTQKPIQIAFKYPESEDCYVLNLREKGALFCPIEAVWKHENAFAFAGFDFFRSGKIHLFLPETITKYTVEDFAGLILPDFDHPTNHQNIDTPKNTFLKNVNEAKVKFQESNLKKVAISRVKNVGTKKGLTPNEIFSSLCRNFSNAFVFYINSPQTGIWAGATPECLFSVRENQVKSMSLAGTLSDSKDNEWTTKEYVEQNIVTEYLKQVFLESGFESVSVSKPNVLKIGKLNHLKTDFVADYKHDDFKKLSDFIRVLHPTPAVGGYPKKEAIRFIEESEQHNRLFYTGFSGMINFKHGSDLFVNLRLFQVFENSLCFYAGAGITDASDAEKEWEETENKIQMTAALFADYY